MKKILLVDDVKDLADVLADTLRMNGHEVIVSYSGKEALNIVEKDREIALIVTDILMPDIDGIDIIDHIKEHNADISIIAMSGGGVTLQSDDVLRIVKEKVDAFLKKPVCLETFISTVSELMGN